jgi:hypothetical protein
MTTTQRGYKAPHCRSQLVPQAPCSPERSHKRLHTHRTFDEEQSDPNERRRLRRFCRALFRTRTGDPRGYQDSVRCLPEDLRFQRRVSRMSVLFLDR